MSNKEKKPKESPSKDSDVQFGTDSQQYSRQSVLSLPKALKDYLKDQNLDFRFMNATEFRKYGGIHRAHFTAFEVPHELRSSLGGVFGVTADGLIQRGDAILGVRPKRIADARKAESDAQKKQLYRQTSVAAQAKKLKEHVDKGSLADETRIIEGYDEE